MTGVMTEVSAPCEGPGGALIYLDIGVMAATPDAVLERTQESMTK